MYIHVRKNVPICHPAYTNSGKVPYIHTCQARTLKLEQGGSYLGLAGPKVREAGPIGGWQENIGLRPSEIVSGAIWRYNSNSWTMDNRAI